MAKQPAWLSGFVQKPYGKAFFIALAILLTFAVYVYVYTLLAIPAVILFGLAVPIWVGLKRPRYLVIMGLLIVLVVAPVSTVVFTQEIREPIAAASSLTDIPGTNGTALLQNAQVWPYTGTSSTNFTWNVTIVPAGIPQGNTTPIWLELYISTCPGATSTNPPGWCSAGYSFVSLNASTYPDTDCGSVIANLTTAPKSCTFHYQIGSDGIWDWQMGVYTQNKTTGAPYYQNLVGDPTYNGLEGPVVGDFASTYGAVLPTIFFDDALFLGAPFFILLLLYLLFKNREKKKKDAAARAAGPVPPTGSPEGSALPPSLSKGPPPGSTAAPPVKERTCPNCNAVVYENETICWKCGASLTSGGGGSPPMPSSTKSP